MTDQGKSVETVLAERGSSYGKFEDRAKLAMQLKEVMRGSTLPPVYFYDPLSDEEMEKLKSVKPGELIVKVTPKAIKPSPSSGWSRLAPDQAQALDTIADKIARILNGDPNYDDNWRDIAGYATLVLKRLEAEQS